ncbi:CsbD family protein [Nocardioides alcanivorans]|uniref:CsbD family protein n=1 Tax=Nocardioides alcanivorans TaxID=2897352 RepID=UPI001F461E1C|nr:CsbD family protein [Nocardioides alcanivorans]
MSRIARLPRVLATLAEHRDGMPLATLAAAEGIGEKELREDLLAYFTADPMWTLGLSRVATLEFLGPDGSEEDPTKAEVVRVVSDADDLGVELLDADELALIHTAAVALLELQPDDDDLASAVDVLTETMLGAPAEPRHTAHGEVLGLLQDAVTGQQVVRIEYSRAWHAGVSTRDIHPLRLVQTRRGWEVDAGPVGADGALRTYLLSNIRSAETTGEGFEPRSASPSSCSVSVSSPPCGCSFPRGALVRRHVCRIGAGRRGGRGHLHRRPRPAGARQLARRPAHARRWRGDPGALPGRPDLGRTRAGAGVARPPHPTGRTLTSAPAHRRTCGVRSDGYRAMVSRINRREHHMGFEEKADDLKGRAKEAAGAATNDDELKNEGKADQAKASIKEKVESVADSIKDKLN